MCTPFRLLGAGIVIPGSLCQLRQASLVFSLAWMGGKVRHTAAVLSGNKTVAALSSVYGPATLCFAGDTGEAAREGICRHVLGPDAVFRRRTDWAVPLPCARVFYGRCGGCSVYRKAVIRTASQAGSVQKVSHTRKMKGWLRKAHGTAVPAA